MIKDRYQPGDIVIFIGRKDPFAASLIPGKQFIIESRWDSTRYSLRDCNFLVQNHEIILSDIYKSPLYEAMRETEED